MLTTLLVRNGYHVDAVFDGYEGIEKARSERYDLVVTDMHMADTDGLEVIESIRRFARDIPIIGISGGDALHSRDMSKLDQARETCRVFKKPFEHEAFLKAVKESLDGKSRKKNRSGLGGLLKG
jgi:two-component system chemotaxis response regulator CheY